MLTENWKGRKTGSSEVQLNCHKSATASRTDANKQNDERFPVVLCEIFLLCYSTTESVCTTVRYQWTVRWTGRPLCFTSSPRCEATRCQEAKRLCRRRQSSRGTSLICCRTHRPRRWWRTGRCHGVSLWRSVWRSSCPAPCSVIHSLSSSSCAIAECAHAPTCSCATWP